MSIGFTGTKLGMSDKQHWAVVSLMGKFIGEHGEFHHGDCEGADVQAARIANWFHYKIVCHPPMDGKHRGWFKYNTETRPRYDYIVRDRNIVNETNVLIATPHGIEIARSGTWTTVRYARYLGQPIYIVKRDGEIETENI